MGKGGLPQRPLGVAPSLALGTPRAPLGRAAGLSQGGGSCPAQHRRLQLDTNWCHTVLSWSGDRPRPCRAGLAMVGVGQDQARELCSTRSPQETPEPGEQQLSCRKGWGRVEPQKGCLPARNVLPEAEVVPDSSTSCKRSPPRQTMQGLLREKANYWA